jgi:hypothetical protein
MRFSSPNLLRRALPLALAISAAIPAAAQGPQDSAMDARHLIYLPSRSSDVDHDAIIQTLGDNGFNVITLPYAGETRPDYAHRVASEIRALTARGVGPGDITVLGAGSGTSVAILTSAVMGTRRVNYVLLGECDPLLKVDYRFRMSGRVLGLRDVADSGSQSCRPLWTDSPKVSARRDMVLSTAHGAALFNQPRVEWLQPVLEWSGGGRVDVGKIRIGGVQRSLREAAGAATGAGN